MGGIAMRVYCTNFSASRSVDAETGQDGFDIGGPDADILPHQSRMGALVKSLKKRHFGSSVTLGRDQRTAVLVLPGAHRLVQHEDRNRSGGFAVGRHVENEFGAGFAFAREGALAFVIVL